MVQATRIPGPPSDNQILHKTPPHNAWDRFDSRGRLDRDGFHLPEWLKQFARSLGTVNRDGFHLPERLKQFARSLGVVKARSGTATVNHAAYPPVSPPPDRRATQEPEPDDAPDGFDWLGWLKHFVLYLCAVTLICLIGLYFLWQIPFLRDPSQLLEMVDDSHAPRPATATATATAPPATPAPAVQAVPSAPPVATTVAPSAPPVTTTAAPSPLPVTTTVAPGQPPVSTDALVATTAPAVPPTEPAGAEPSLEPQPATAPDSQTTPAMPPTEPIAEAVPPPPPTPQAELEQLLSNAQQQMDNRRFTAPSSGNALSTYRRILELQPDHPAALEGIQRITAYYQDIAQQSLRQGRLDESLAYINRGLRATPKNDALLSLRRQVQQAQKAARQREREEQQKRAALEEMQRQQLEPIQREQPRRQQEQQLPWWRQPPPPNESGGFNQR
jgi:hypothetical protein